MYVVYDEIECLNSQFYESEKLLFQEILYLRNSIFSKFKIFAGL